MTQTETKRIRLLLVDDHEMVRVGLRTVLARFPQIQIVAEAGSVAAAVAEAKQTKPDVVLLDIRLPDGTGYEACRQIREAELEARVLILTAFADDETVLRSIQAGADGYLLKEINAEGLVSAIDQVASGKSILDPAVVSRVMRQVQALSNGTKGKMELLSAQEHRVLALVAEGKTNKEIGLALGLSDKTVKNYLSNILDKLQLSRRSQAAAFFARHIPR
jgi:two-component system, NarL family, response regulator DevR